MRRVKTITSRYALAQKLPSDSSTPMSSAPAAASGYEARPPMIAATKLMKVAAAGAVGAVAGSLLAGGDGRASAQAPALATLPNVKRNAAFTVDEKVDPLTSYAQITSFNNYYEFGGYKSDPARTAGRLKVKPWTV